MDSAARAADRKLAIAPKFGERTTGAQVLADMLAGYGVTHVFMVPAVLRRTMAELERRTAIHRVQPSKAPQRFPNYFCRQVFNSLPGIYLTPSGMGQMK